jgi:hypothetical protein
MRHAQKWFLFLLVVVSLLAASLLPRLARPATAADPSCRVIISAGLRMRRGPGEAPVIRVLTRNTLVTPLGVIPNRTWAHVRTAAGETGWVSTRTDLLRCDVALTTLPIVPNAPTPVPPGGAVAAAATATAFAAGNAPLPTPMLTRVASPTPYQAAYSNVPSGVAQLRELPVSVSMHAPDDVERINDKKTPVFRDRVDFKAITGTSNEGATIVNVEFTIRDAAGQVVYFRREENAEYCAFGGDGPVCTPLDLVRTFRWPGTNIPISDGDYRLTVQAIDSTGSKSFPQPYTFRIERGATVAAPTPVVPTPTAVAVTATPTTYRLAYTDLPADGASDPDLEGYVWALGANLVAGETVFDRALELRLEASYGGQPNGAGIEAVRFTVFDGEGTLVHDHTESNYPYCMFANATNDCENVWFFAETGYAWPQSGVAINADAPYVANIEVTTESGATGFWTITFRLRP